MHQPLVPTPYIVLCRGRRIGFTELGFTRYYELARAGWFIPDSDADAAVGVDPDNTAHLELRDPDGAIVPTESIGIQDTHRLLALGRECVDAWDPDADAEDLIEDECESDNPAWSPELDEADAEMEFEVPEWLDDESDVDLPRYQILLTLAFPNAIP